MAGKFFPTVDHPAVQENLHLLNLTPAHANLCGYDLYQKYTCENCPFGKSPIDCVFNKERNPHLSLFLTQLRLAHPELFI
jgi:hypothetical protein